MAVDTFFEAVHDPAVELTLSDYQEVSDLGSVELSEFASGWQELPVDQQQEIVAAMARLSEESSDLDFAPVFKMCLRNSEDDDVLVFSIEGLWEHEDRSIIAPLTGLLASDLSPRVRATAALGLGKFTVLAQEGKLLARDGDLVYQSLLTPLEDEDEYLEVRRRCLESIAGFNTDEIEGYVIWAYNSEDQDLKSSSIYAMGRTGELAWLPTLLRELDSPDAAVRYETAHACGDLGDEDAVLHLVDLLDDEDAEVQLAGIAALGKIGGPVAKKVLMDCASAGDARLEDAARAELENIEFLEDPFSMLDN